MVRSKSTLGVAITVALISLLISAYAKQPEKLNAQALGIELALEKPFYIPAATSDKVTSMVIRVPVEEGNDRQQDSVSAIKLEPKMENDKVSVRVYALVGETDNIITCRDWDSLKSIEVGTYVAGLDEEVSLSKLREYGVRFGTEPLTFRIVPKKALSPLPYSVPCDCGACGGLICCPNPGHCLVCNPCGQVCCQG
jgi:hypothetical protein